MSAAAPGLALFARGFGLSAGLIVAIGAQNAFVLKQGLLRTHVFAVALLCSLFDALFITLGSFGFGSLVASSPLALRAILYAGVAFLGYYGFRAFRSAMRPGSLEVAQGPGARPMALRAALLTATGFTVLNPHVYLDTIMLVGGIAAQVPPAERVLFVAGAVTASFSWFFALGYGARWLAPVFRRPAAWRVLDAAIGVVMWAIAASLLLQRS